MQLVWGFALSVLLLTAPALAQVDSCRNDAMESVEQMCVGQGTAARITGKQTSSDWIMRCGQVDQLWQPYIAGLSACRLAQPKAIVTDSASVVDSLLRTTGQ